MITKQRLNKIEKTMKQFAQNIKPKCKTIKGLKFLEKMSYEELRAYWLSAIK